MLSLQQSSITEWSEVAESLSDEALAYGLERFMHTNWLSDERWNERSAMMKEAAKRLGAGDG